MGTLTALKLVAAQIPTKLAPEQQRRAKLVRRLDEQIAIAKAKQDGTAFVAKKIRNVYDEATGTKTQVEMNKRVKAWWFPTSNGKIALSVRYGAKVLELAKGKFAVEVADEKDLVRVLTAVRTATIDGELDAAIESAANKLRDGFVQ